MEARAKSDIQAIHQLPKLKSLLKKYRQVKTMQSGLLQLSELASTVVDMPSFYCALESVIKTLLITDSFHIVLLNRNRQLSLTHSHNSKEDRLLEHLDIAHWQHSLTGLVFDESHPLHCSSAERMALARAEKIAFYGSPCVDWLGVPLKRGHQTIGVIALQSYDKKLYFDDRDCQLLEFIAEHLVTAIDRVRSRELLEKNIRQRTQKLTATNVKLQQEIAERQKAVKMHKALLAISELSSSQKDIDSFYQTLHVEVDSFLSAKNLYIALLSDDAQTLTFPYYQNEVVIAPKSRVMADGLTELAIRTASPLLITDGNVYILSEQGAIKKQKATFTNQSSPLPKAWLGAPLIENGKIIGVLGIQHYQNEHAYQFCDLELIRFVSQHIASAIMRKKAQKAALQSHEALEKVV